MAGLPWVRLDAAFPTNPKVLELLELKEGHRTGFVYLCGLAYAGQHGTDGLISVGALPFIHGRVADATRLVRVRLWHDYPDGGWLINNWEEFQMTSLETIARRERAQNGAAARWNGHGPAKTDAERAAAYRARKAENRDT